LFIKIKNYYNLFYSNFLFFSFLCSIIAFILFIISGCLFKSFFIEKPKNTIKVESFIALTQAILFDLSQNIAISQNIFSDLIYHK
jgi:hypothetical protein